MRRRAGDVARVAVAAVVTTIGLFGSALAPAGAAVATVAPAAPFFSAPWACGVAWHASTYAGHIGRGVDFNQLADGSDDGAPVLASAPGTATIGWTDRYGNVVDVDHGGGWRTRYAHLAEPPVLVDRDPDRAGVQVWRGDAIGRVGSTGNSSAPHLHYEQRLDDVGRDVTFDGRTIAVGASYDPAIDPLVRSAKCDPGRPGTPLRGSEGRVYRVDTDGTLRWSDRPDPAATDLPLGGGEVATVVGAGFGRFRTLTSGGDGVLYGIASDGVLRWYRHLDPVSGAARWQVAGFGSAIGNGWARFRQVVGAGGGVLYAVETDGRLTWWRHLGVADGTASWAAGSGTVIGAGFDRCVRLLAAGDGILYCVRSDGTLQWWRHLGGPVAAWQGGTVVGDGWLQPTAMWSGGNGVLFAVGADGVVRRYRHLGARTGAYQWAATEFGGIAGTGWTPGSFGAVVPAG